MLNSRTLPTTKKRLAGSCDRCRRKKVKCDSATIQENICSNCVAFNAECTHTDLIKRRGSMSRQDSLPATGSSKRQGPDISYVHSLERRLNQLERILKEVNLPKEMAEQEILVHGGPISSISQQASQSNENTEPDDDFSYTDLLESLKRLSFHHFENFSQRYYGSSSSFSLLTDAISITRESTGNRNIIQFREYFDLQPWEQATANAEIPRYVYPDNDLIRSLVSIYFETINPIFPILHRPTFEQNVDEALHLQDHSFGAALLLVLAVASRYSNDLRVLADPCSKLSSGWRFFEQVNIFKKVVYAPPCLYDLQVTVLGGIYTMGTSIPEFSWTLIGAGLRSAIDIGLHRRKPDGYKFTAEDELKKRSFWALIFLDRLVGLYAGYPAMMRDEEFDLQTPIECDDEYWEIAPDGQVDFNQPSGKPSKISYFSASIKLSEIMSVAMKTSFSLKKARDMLGLTGKNWEQRLVSDLDSSLNAWEDSVPDHIRWNPSRCDNETFLYQSATLYSVYYMLQILIHRPLLRTGCPLSMPSLVICINAARSYTRILEVHRTGMRTINPQIIVGTFTSGSVFAMNIWSCKRAGRAPNKKDVAGFQVCVATFEDAADTWNIVGRSLILFRAMASVESPPPRLHENVTVAPAPSTWSSYDAVTQTALVENVQPFYEQTPYLDNYLATLIGAEFHSPLEPHLGSSYITPESGIGGDLSVDIWTDAPPAFGFSEWNAYVASMARGENERP
ncbi:fungal-specific transcription factor domain-containing protein [Armillaria luteobubalina]|uniref:Fungal-specific transcription factor domain-containing protein n=1 Tax=Armillaria luteobubalina TaxID=153913 RepID=A0AA39Q781_9AGAR|nr:fungal-specific transcription factor domain-containing protein [Armillaria luteobubalina]